MSERIVGLPAIIPPQCRILILGSMPGVKSLLKQEYYGNPQNQFWTILFELLSEPFSSDYSKRKQLLAKYRIGLWDVIGSCVREGSSDSAILAEAINDIPKLLKQYPTLKAIFFDGLKSSQLFKKHFPHLDVHAEYLPSTSGLNTQPIVFKKEQWKKLLKFI